MRLSKGRAVAGGPWRGGGVLVAALVATVLGACSPMKVTRGNLVDDDRLAGIRAGTSRQSDVAVILGSPTAVATFDPNTWYYIGQRTEQTAFLDPEVTERRVLIVRFDDAGVVRELEELGADDGQEVQLSARETPTAGRDLSFLEQMLGNIGRFSGGDRPAAPGGLGLPR